MRRQAEEIRVLSTTAILGYGFPERSFLAGIRRKPHVIGVDAGSSDPGPYYLGAGQSFTNRKAVKRDLRYMITAGVRLKVPVIIGSAGGSGAAPHVEWCREIIDEIAREERLSFRMGIVWADIPHAAVIREVRARRIESLPFVPRLTEPLVRETGSIVAQMGMEPLIRALDAGCDVVLAGRCYDPAVFAAVPVRAGFDKGLALHMGKILECAAIAATPGSGADCVMGTIRKDCFILESLNPARKFTCQSTAAHTLYEKSDPYHLPGPGGMINLEGCSFREIGDGVVEVRGSRYEQAPRYRVKLEGARQIGYRSVSIAGTRDPVMIRDIDAILAAVRTQLGEFMRREKVKGVLNFHVYGKNAVMGTREPVQGTRAHELGILIDAVGSTEENAAALCSVARSTLLHYGYPGRISTAGNLAFPFSPSDAKMGKVFEFSVYHLMTLRSQRVFRMTRKEYRHAKAAH